MKKYLLVKYLLLLSIIVSQYSCSKKFADEIKPEDLSWKANSNLEVTVVENKGTLVWNLDKNSWNNSMVEFNVQLKSQLPVSQFLKVDFFVTAQEDNAYNFSAPFDTKGKKLSSVTNLPTDGKFSVSVKQEVLYSLFKDDFINNRSEPKLLETDIFEIHWVITHKDGSTFDSRDNIGSEYRRGFSVKYVSVWAGTFKYEFIDATDEAIEYWEVSIGDNGTITTSKNTSGTYDVPNLLFNNIFGGEGTLSFDFTSGETFVEGSVGEVWNIINVDGASLDIELEYEDSFDFNEYATVRLTRTDGDDWPTNINSIK